MVISFSGEGAKMLVHAYMTGEQAAEMREVFKAAALSNITDAVSKKLYLDVWDGKLVTITPANTEIWGIFAPTYDVTATLNDADKTFTSIEEWG